MNVNTEKVTKKIREEENASGIAVNDLTEKEALIEELVSREDIVNEWYDPCCGLENSR